MNHPRSAERARERSASAADAASSLDFRHIVDTLSEGVGVVCDGRWSYLNAAALRLLGAHNAEELVGQPALDRVHEADRAEVADRLRRASDEGLPNPPFAQRLVRLDGALIEVEAVSGPCQAAGAPAVQVVFRDVTARRAAERALRESEERFATVFRASPVSMSLSGLADGRLLDVNAGFERITGYHRDEVLGRTSGEIGLFADEGFRAELLERLHRDGAARALPVRFRRRDGELRRGELAAEIVELAGEPHLLLVGEDVTDRRRSEAVQAATYRISEAAHSAGSLDELYREIHTVVADLMPAKNFYLAIHDRALGVLHYPYWVDEFDPPPPSGSAGDGLTELVLRTGEPLLASPEVFAELVRRGDVAEVGAPSIDWLGVPLEVDGETLGVLVVQSYTEGVRFAASDLEILRFVSRQIAMSIVRKGAEERLRESEGRYRSLVAGAPEAILVYDVEARRFVDSNGKAAELFGRGAEELEGCDWMDLSPATQPDGTASARALAPLVADALAGAQPVFEWTHRRSSGDELLCEVRFAPLGGGGRPLLRASITDITPRRRRQRLLQSVAEGISATTGEAFFRSLVLHLARTLGVAFALVGERITCAAGAGAEDQECIRTLAFVRDGEMVESTVYPLAGTPCAGVVGNDPRAYPEGVQGLFPDDPMLPALEVESYLGVPLFDHNGDGLGLLVVMDRRPLPEPEVAASLLRIFAARAAGELERTRAEAALRTSEERYRAFVEQSSEAIWCAELREPVSIDAPEEEQVERMLGEGYLLECNAAMAQMYGFSRAEQIEGMALARLLDPADPRNRDYLRQFVRSGYRLTDAESHELARDGAAKDFLNNLVGVIEDGRLVRAWGTQRDVTERRRAESVLRQQSAALKASMDGVAILDEEARLVFANDAYARTYGLPVAALVGRPLATTFAPTERQRLLDEILPRLRAAGEWRGAAIGLRGDGTTFPQEVSLNRIEGDGLVLVVRDASARVAAEEALRQSEEQFRSVFEAVGDAVYVSTPAGRLLDINRAGVELFGYASREELVAVDIGSDLFADPRERDRTQRLLREQGYVKDLELHLRRKDGQRLVVLETATAVRDEEGRVVAFRGILRDVTERRSLEEQLRQAQKMEAVGRLAGGVAHDFNNLLTAITGYSDLLLARLAPEANMRREIEEIKRAGSRAADLTRQLLAFSRRQVLSARVLSLNRVVTDIEKLLRRVIGEDVQLVTDLSAELGAVRADPGQLEQVVMNLSVNARDAMPQGGTLLLRTANVVLDEDYSRRHLEVRPGEYVLLQVTDTGEGIAREVREHIFEPFFTTKEIGRGTGLGLSMVYGIVRQSGGHIEVESQPGVGTTFRIYLPRVNQEVDAPAPALGPDGPPRGHESVLVVEDEPAVQQLVRRILEDRGYQVQVASYGTAALSVADRMEALDLLVTDVVMPGLSGPELAAEMVRRHPRMRVLFMSGYNESFVGRQGVPQPADRFLQKPFTPEALARKVREILDAES